MKRLPSTRRRRRPTRSSSRRKRHRRGSRRHRHRPHALAGSAAASSRSTARVAASRTTASTSPCRKARRCKAAENGVVIYAGDGLKEFGNTVLVRHEDGLVTVYGHASELKVQRGEKVKRGQEIAVSGMSGTTRRAEAALRGAQELRAGRSVRLPGIKPEKQADRLTSSLVRPLCPPRRAGIFSWRGDCRVIPNRFALFLHPFRDGPMQVRRCLDQRFGGL